MKSLLNVQRRSTRAIALHAAACAALFTATASADQLALWNFNSGSTAPTSFNSNFISTPNLALLGGISSNFAGANGSSDPTQPGQGFNTVNYPAVTSANLTAGIRFNFNTTNFDVTTFSFDWRTSNSASRWMQLEYTLDGAAWNSAAATPSAGGDTWNNGLGFDFSSIPAASNNANFGIRMVSKFSPDGFTQSSSPFTAYGPDQAYRAAHIDDRAYAPSSSWRFDMVTLNGAFNGGPFAPTTLTWNTSSGTWNTDTNNKPWLNPLNQASSFAQSSGQGDIVTFNNPAANSVVTVQAAGVTPNSTTITNNATLTFSGGSLNGTGGLIKNGTGLLILTASNGFTGAQNPTQINGGTVETRAGTGLGTGNIDIGNATWHITTAAQSAPGIVRFTAPTTFRTDASLTITSGLDGSGDLIKSGNGTLAVAGLSTNSGAINITAGSVRMDGMAALGGSAPTEVSAGPMTINNAALVVSATGNNALNRTRLTGNLSLTNASITRTQLTPDLGSATTNGDSDFSSYTVGAAPLFVGGILSVSGNALIQNLETRTATATDIPGSGGIDNALVIRMPVLVTAGSTLTLSAANGTLSTVGGELTGVIANTAVALRGTTTDTNPNDSVTLAAGATIAMSGPGEKRFGSSNTGKPLIGQGTPAAESTLRADGRTFMTDLADVGTNNTLLIVSGQDTAGLRVEAPMNASYSPDPAPFSTFGLFGNNPDPLPTTEGNIYTLLSPNRYAGISDGGPTVAVDGTPVTRAGTFTVAASDPAGATGTVNNGPANGTSIKLGLDNTSSSGTSSIKSIPSQTPHASPTSADWSSNAPAHPPSPHDYSTMQPSPAATLQPPPCNTSAAHSISTNAP